MKRPLVVGYKGEIGRFILAGLLKAMPKALDIFCVDKSESTREVVARIKKSDIIFLCVPMQDTIPWLKQYAKHLKGKTIVEQTSLKRWAVTLDIKKSFPGVKLIHMHILFRPSDTPNKEDRKVVLVQRINDLSKHTMNRLFYDIAEITDSSMEICNSIEEHDSIMAVHQALTHRVIVRLADEVAKLPHKTFVSQKVIELANRIKKGGDLIRQLQNNPDTFAVVSNFKHGLSSQPLF